jgi:hypothetical protein
MADTESAAATKESQGARPGTRAGGTKLRIVDQPFVVGLVVDDGTNVVHVDDSPEGVDVPDESLQAVYDAAFDARILLEEVS